MERGKAKVQQCHDPTRLLAVRLLHRLFIPWVAVEDEERLPLDGNAKIFAFNHNNSFETLPLALYLAFKRRGMGLTFLSDWMYGRLPVIGWLFRQVDPVYVGNKPARYGFLNRGRRRTSIAVKAYAECIERLKKNESIGIFPEGTRNRCPDLLLRGRQGIGEIVLRSGVPVVPIGIDFPTRLKRGYIPVVGSMILRIGPSLDFSREISAAASMEEKGISPFARRRIWAFLRKTVTHSVMSVLAELCGKRYPYPPPVMIPEADGIW